MVEWRVWVEVRKFGWMKYGAGFGFDPAACKIWTAVDVNTRVSGLYAAVLKVVSSARDAYRPAAYCLYMSWPNCLLLFWVYDLANCYSSCSVLGEITATAVGLYYADVA